MNWRLFGEVAQMMARHWLVFLFAVLWAAAPGTTAEPQQSKGARPAPGASLPRPFKVIHVIVTLCDNRNQGIVPVPAALGNGQDPDRNLYWGALFGVRTYFGKSDFWQEVSSWNPPAGRPVLAGAVFASRSGPEIYVVAEAFDGAKMKSALHAFLSACHGQSDRREIVVRRGSRQVKLPVGSRADMVCFVGHNGLMDMDAPRVDPAPDGTPRPAAALVLACRSRDYFEIPLALARCPLRVLTTQLMSPEAYTLDAVIRSWVHGDDPAGIRDAAAAAYARYQKCSLSAARKMFVAERDPRY
jgi:hypothetical protein